MISEKMKKLLIHFNLNDKKKLSIILIILISLELIQILIISLLFRKILFFLICIEILIHYFFLYLIIHKLLFSGSSILITRYNCWCLGLEISKIFGEKLEDFKNSFDDFYFNNEKKNTKFNLNELYSKSEKLNSINDLLSSYLKLSNTVEETKMSSYQKDMVVSLNKLKMIIDESKIDKTISETIINVFKNKEPKLYSNDLNNTIDKIKTQINIILLKIKNFQLGNNFFKNILNFLFNDTFGSLIQLKNEILSRYHCEPFKLNTNDNKFVIDCLLIKNKGLIQNKNNNNEKKQIESILEVEEDQKEDIDQKIELINEKEKELKEKNKQREENNKNTVIVICNKTIYPYELSAYYDKWVDYYLSLGINVILWNYRGYGSSNGSPSLENIQTDAEQLIKYIKKIYSFSNIGVHGINIGGLVASYLCSQNLVNFCFVDRCFNSLYAFMDESISSYFHYLFKIFFINDCDLSLLLNQNLKKHNIYKVISYSIKKDFIDHDISVKNMIANDFISKILNKNEMLLKTILYNGGNKFEYDLFIKNLFYIIEKVLNFINSKDIKNNEISPEQEYNNIYETVKVLAGDKYEENNKNDNLDSASSLDKELSDSSSIKIQEMNVLNSITQIFEKFDAGGETILSLYSNKINNTKNKNITLLNKEEILNNFLTNLFSWGSYKIGKEYVTELLVAYKAIEKKLSFVNRKINKILSEPKKYVISDINISLALKNILENFEKIESFFNDKFIYKEINYYKKNKEMSADSTNNSFSSNKSSENDSTYRFNINEVLNKNLLDDNCKIVDFIKDLNIGNLLILNSENDKQYSNEEIKMLTLFFINSNFIK